MNREEPFHMPEIHMYTSAVCAYCMAAKRLLKARGMEWQEIRIDIDPTHHREMLERSSGRRTVPQIFVNGQHVGGFDELAAADRDGRLDAMLEQEA